MKFSHLILIFLLLLFFALVAILFFTGLPKSTAPTSFRPTLPTENVPPGIVRAPTPYLLLPSGRQEYLVKSNPLKDDAVAKKIIADPLDAPKGTSQTISIDLSHTKSITAVTLALATDSMSKTYPLILTSGSKNEGTWSGTWDMEDNHEEKYSVQFTVTDSDSHKTTIDFPIR